MRLLRPATITDAVHHLTSDRDGALLYAGGVEVALGLRSGGRTCTSLIDTKRIAGSYGISVFGDEVRVGPATTHNMIASNPLIAAELPLLGEACGHLGTVRIRTQGTIGGNFAFAHPHTDPGTAAQLYSGFVDLVSGSGPRSVSIEDFWIAPYTSACGRDEIIESIRLRPLGSGWITVHERLETVHRPPTAIACLAARIADERMLECRIAVGAVPPRPLRLRSLEMSLAGVPVDDIDSVIAKAIPDVAQDVSAQSDLLGSADFKVAVLTGLIRRAAGLAVDRSRHATTEDRA
jgi:aerobic carbon-monoxide dehydrogenase medium subunit